MTKAVALASITIATLLLACGGSDDTEPKRAVDARTEAIHFFPAGAPFVAFLDPSAPSRPEPAPTARSLAGVPSLAAFAGDAAGYIERAGLDLDSLTPLLTDEELEDGVHGSQAALGLQPAGRPREDVLVVIVSEQTEAMEEAVEQLAAASGLAEADGFHDARVFAKPGVALSLRDGVVVIGPDTDRLRSALRLRDADQDEQLDEGRVADVLDELPGEPPLLAYADLPGLRSDPGVAAVTLGERAWLRSLNKVAIGVTPETSGVRVEIAAEVDSEAVERGETLEVEIPIGEQQQELALGSRGARGLVSGGFAATSPFADAVVALAPFVARASVSEDELRATILSRR
jgi:hypothetical protein